MIDELLDELVGVKIFNKLDFKSRYYQIWVREEDVENIVFRMHEGHYEFLVMPFELSNVLTSF